MYEHFTRAQQQFDVRRGDVYYINNNRGQRGNEIRKDSQLISFPVWHSERQGSSSRSTDSRVRSLRLKDAFRLAAIRTEKVARFTQRKLLWKRLNLQKARRQQATTSQDRSQHQAAAMVL